MDTTKKPRCEAKHRNGIREDGTWIMVQCRKRAKGFVLADVGLTKTHFCCGNRSCTLVIADGYNPANFTSVEL